VVAIYKNNDPTDIVWSYHIWVPQFLTNPTEITYTYPFLLTSVVFMDRNLGATHAGTDYGKGTGLFYQWGSKDAFPATGNAGEDQPGSGRFTSTAIRPMIGTIPYTIAHPDEFIYSDGQGDVWGNWLWYIDENLWGHGNGVKKTIYDPCPSGWRVPDIIENDGGLLSPWNVLAWRMGAWERYGFVLGDGMMIPACGYRYAQSNQIPVTDAGIDGLYWQTMSDVMYPHSAYNLYMTPSNQEGLDIDIKYNGLSVRCVKEAP
jgi:hypothetical protein